MVKEKIEVFITSIFKHLYFSLGGNGSLLQYTTLVLANRLLSHSMIGRIL
jgi:hypothetical protein